MKKRKLKKKKGYRDDLKDDSTMHEKIKPLPKKASKREVLLIIDSLVKHFFFESLSNEEM